MEADLVASEPPCVVSVLATKQSPACKTKQNLLAFFQIVSFDGLSLHVEIS